MQTASAVLGDVVSAARRHIAGGVGVGESTRANLPVVPIGHVTTRYQITLSVLDAPGVLASIATMFSDHGVSVEAVSQSVRDGADVVIAGGVESMTRAPFVLAKAETAFSRQAEIHDTTIGWRFVNPLMKAAHGIDSMPETAENVAQEFGISRADQDAFALASQQKTAAAIEAGATRPRDVFARNQCAAQCAKCVCEMRQMIQETRQAFAMAAE